MEKVKKIFLVILILIISLSGVVLAEDSDITNIVENTNPTVPESTTFITAANTIIGGIQLVCNIIAILIIIVVGIKYMMGSVEEKADYKGKIFAYIIGAVILFGISNILSLISNIMQ